MPYVNLDMRKEAVTPLIFNPVGDRTKQTKWDGEENFQPSVIDPYFQKQRYLGEIDPQSKTEKKLGRVIDNVLHATPSEAAIVGNEILFLTDNAQTLKDHLDARICGFFRQLVDVYDQPYALEIGKVEDQLKSSTTMRWQCKDTKQSGSLSFQSTHYGTLPCVIAYPREEYAAWLARPTRVRKPDGHVLGKYSDTYNANNACAGHITVVNEADSQMDYKGGKDIILRPFAVELLNASSQTQIDPISGMRLFIGKLSVAVESLLATRRSPSEQIIFQTYRRHLAEIRTMIEERPHEFFTFLLGIEIDENDPRIQKLSTTIYPHRFKTLQTLSDCQTQIAARITLAKQRVLDGATRKPSNFDKAFKAYIILNTSHLEKVGKIFQRYFCTSVSQAQQIWDECSLKRGYSQAQNKCLAAEAEMQALFADVNKLIHNHSVDVSLLRANLLRQLRELQDWSQRKVAYKVNQISPTENLYQQQLSRIELGYKKITNSLADVFSQVFGVHRSVFIPDSPLTA